MPTLNIKSTQQAIKVGEHKGEEMFVMKVEHYNTMDAEKIIDYAAETYCIPRGMLRASWEAIGQVVSTWALEGHIVEIPGLGNIRAEVRAKAQKEAKDVSVDDVFRRKLLLTPTKRFFLRCAMKASPSSPSACDYGHKQREQSGACSKVEELDEVNFAESRQKKTESQYNRQAKNQGRLKATLCLMALVMMLISACSSNNQTHTILGSEQSDSVSQEKNPASSKTTDAQTPSIFDELANNMVCVEVDTGNFYICKYEVTQKLWTEVMGDNPSEMQGNDLPVEQVSWNDCHRFIAKLNGLTGKHYRLPTEAEWEYACRGGKHSKGFKYSGSNDIDEVAWYDGNSEDKTHPVGQKKPNELGLYDMSGNVWEWCQDMHEGIGMCRGGSWIHNARNCDPSLPNETPQSFSIDCLGLRLAL